MKTATEMSAHSRDLFPTIDGEHWRRMLHYRRSKAGLRNEVRERILAAVRRRSRRDVGNGGWFANSTVRISHAHGNNLYDH